MFYDLYELLLACVTGLVKAFSRFVLVVLATLFSLPRMDVSIFPAWLDYYIALDSGARAYHAVILSYHARTPGTRGSTRHAAPQRAREASADRRLSRGGGAATPPTPPHRLDIRPTTTR